MDTAVVDTNVITAGGSGGSGGPTVTPPDTMVAEPGPLALDALA